MSGMWREEEDDREDDDDHADERRTESRAVSLPVLMPGGIFRIEEHAARDRAEEQADAVHGLREIDARRRVLRRTEHGGVRIRDRFEKGEAGGDDADAQQERPELRDVRRRE